jgi:hypothetical protein
MSYQYGHVIAKMFDRIACVSDIIPSHALNSAHPLDHIARLFATNNVMSQDAVFQVG